MHVVCVVAATAPTCVASVVPNDFMLILKHCYFLLLLLLLLMLLLLQDSVHLLTLLLLLAHVSLFGGPVRRLLVAMNIQVKFSC
jgi:hypothetical protein